MASSRTSTQADPSVASVAAPAAADLPSRAVGASVHTEIAFVGRCFPSGRRGEPVAGDFFEVCALDGTRTLIMVGDLIGHGLDVGERMSVLREQSRALAMEGLSVAEVVRRLDVWLEGQGPEELATLWRGIFDAETDWLEYVSAGHVPPVLAGVDGDTCLLSEASAPPLGSGEVGRHVLADRARFSAGALLVVYSDGLIERAGLDLEDQIELLRGIVHDVYVPALSQAALGGLVEQVLRRLPTDHANAPDDVCILAVHRPVVPTGDVGYVAQRRSAVDA